MQDTPSKWSIGGRISRHVWCWGRGGLKWVGSPGARLGRRGHREHTGNVEEAGRTNTVSQLKPPPPFTVAAAAAAAAAVAAAGQPPSL